jgi:hypothetical protein
MQDTVEAVTVAAPQDTLHHRSLLLAQPKKAAAWKPYLARLELLERLTGPLRLGARGASGLELREVMKFAGPALAHANGGVRAAAVRLVVACFHAGVRAPVQLSLQCWTSGAVEAVCAWRPCGSSRFGGVLPRGIAGFEYLARLL